MYYIVNQNNHIVAAGKDLLSKLHMSEMQELQKELALETITFSKNSDSEIEIDSSFETIKCTTKHIVLDSLLGELTLVVVEELDAQKDVFNDDDIFSDIINEDSEEDIEINEGLNLEEDSELEDDFTIKTEELPIDDAPEDNISLLDDDDDFLLKESDDEIEPVLEEKKEEQEEDLEPHFNLMEDVEEPSKNVAIENEVAPETEEEKVADTSPIFIDTHKTSNLIGISAEDYNTFLNEYIDTALTLENDLKGSNPTKKNNAIKTLSHLSSVLHLGQIEEIMKRLESSISEEHHEHIEELYNTFARLTTHDDGQEAPKFEESPKLELEDESVEEENLIDLDLDILPTEDEEKSTTPSIDLSSVEPIHFDFQLDEAANDLSLPVELIEEFVVDFIKQAHEETERMLEAYGKGDLSAVQKIGHLLKGTSSNLRINPLAETLYKIQFCEDIKKLEPLIKDYWAHFLSFENKIKLRSN